MSQQKYNKTVQLQVTIIPRQPCRQGIICADQRFLVLKLKFLALKNCDEFAATVFVATFKSLVELESVIVSTSPYFEHTDLLTYSLFEEALMIHLSVDNLEERLVDMLSMPNHL